MGKEGVSKYMKKSFETLETVHTREISIKQK